MLLKGRDPLKDQSYFLSKLTAEQLTKTLFPVGNLYKSEVRRIAEDGDLQRVLGKKEVCWREGKNLKKKICFFFRVWESVSSGKRGDLKISCLR